MKAILRADQQFHHEAERAHRDLLADHAERVAQIEDANRKIEQVAAARERVRREQVRLHEEWKPPRGLRGLLTRKPTPPELPPEPEPIDTMPLPPEPEYLHDGPTTYTVERLPDDYENEDGERFKMIGPIRVLPGEIVVRNDDTGQMHKVAAVDFERDWVQV